MIDKCRDTGSMSLFVLPYCHADYAWTASRGWHVNRYVFIFREALRLAEDMSEFRYFFDGWSEFVGSVIDHLDESEIRQFKNLVKEGRFSFCAGQYANLRLSMAGDETQIRNLQYGLEAVRKVFPDARPTVYANLDVEAGHSQVPQLLNMFGIEGYLFWRPSYFLDREGTPRIFRWKGLSGHRVVAVRQCYSTLTDPTNWKEDWDEFGVKFRQAHLMEMAAENAPVQVVFAGYDDSRPLRSFFDEWLDWPDLVETWNRREDSVMTFGVPEDVFRKIRERQWEPSELEFSEPAGVCYNVAHGGAQGLWRLREELDRRLVVAETIAALDSLAKGGAYPEREIRQAWEDLLTGSAHATEFLFAADFERMRLRLQMAKDTIETLIRQKMTTLLDACLPHAARHLVLFNPSPYSRTERIVLNAPIHDHARQEIVFKDGDHVVPAYGLPFATKGGTRANERRYVFETLLPPMGWKALGVEFKEAKEEPLPTPETVESVPERFDAFDFDVRIIDGVVAELNHRPSGRRLAGMPDNGFFDLVAIPYEGGWLPTAKIASNPVRGECSTLRPFAKNDLCHAYRREGTVAGCSFKQEIVFTRGRPWVEVDTEIQIGPCDQSVHFGLSVPRPRNSRISVDVPFGVEERDLERIRYLNDDDALRSSTIERRFENLFWARQWVDMAGTGASAALISIDGHRYYCLDSRKESLVHLLVRSWRNPDDPMRWEAYAKDATPYGTHRFKHVFVSHDDDWRAARLPRLAENLRNPIEIVYAGDPPDMPNSFMELEPDAAVMTAFLQENGERLLRLRDGSGEGVNATVRLPRGIVAAAKLNPPGETPTELNVRSGRVMVPLKPWEIATVRLSTEGTVKITRTGK